MQIAYSLKNILLDTLKAQKILHWREPAEIAEQNGFKPATAERRLRELTNVIKLNRFNKPIKESERIEWYVWGGGKTVFKK